MNTSGIQVCVTALHSGHRLAKIAQPSLEAYVHKNTEIFLDPEKRFQEIEGFGGAFTESAAVTFAEMPVALQQQVLTAYFDPVEGHGYTLCRTHLNSCDFSLGNYACCDTPDDVELSTFSLDRERKALLPLMRAAQQIAGGKMKLLISPWSPPAWMKTTGRMNQGGSLRPECAGIWAKHYLRFAQELEKEGLPAWGVSVQNEPAATQPWDSCVYTAEQERDFVRDHLGPLLHQAGRSDIRILVWDHNREFVYSRVQPIYDDPEAAKYVWGAGFHWYCGDHFGNLQQVHDVYPDKKLLFTEGCQEDGTHAGSWATGERYARSMINDLNQWTVGWIDWNLLLNETGGPNHVGNYCSAPILYDRTLQRINWQSSYYYIGHFARFIKPGARRIVAASSLDELETTAAINPDGSVAAIVLNRTEQSLPFHLRVADSNTMVESPARSILTVVFEA
jgi:glucosylceramidase